MTAPRPSKTHIGNHALHPETLMLSYGYDPALSEGAVKPPVFLTSTFVFKSAEEGRDFFDYVSGRKEPPRRQRRRPRLFALQPSQQRDRRGPARGLRGRRGLRACSRPACRRSPRRCSPIARPGDVILHSQPLYGGTETLLSRTLSRLRHRRRAASPTASTRPRCARAAAQAGAAKGRVVGHPDRDAGQPDQHAGRHRADARIADEIGASQGIRAGHRLRQHAARPGLPAPARARRRHLALFADQICRRPFRPDRRRGPGQQGGHRADQGAARRHRHAARSAFLLDARPLARDAGDPHGARQRQCAASSPNSCATIPRSRRCIICRSCPRTRRHGASSSAQCTGAGSTFSFDIKGGEKAAFAFLNALQIFKLAVSLGGTESLASHPAAMTHSGVPPTCAHRIGVLDTTIRLSIGIEHPDDLIADLAQALAASG